MHDQSHWSAIPSDIELIDIRETRIGPEAYIVGTRLQVWMTVMLLRELDGDLALMAEHYEPPIASVEAALAYATAHEEEIETAIAEYEAITFEDLKKLIPNITVTEY